MKQLIKTVFVCLCLGILSFSCNRIKEKTKDAIGKTGETVGEVPAEFINGVSDGVDQSLECKLELSSNLTAGGLKVGKFILPDSADGKYTLSAFISFDKDFKKKVTVSVFDESGREYGRTSNDIESKAGEGKYIDFVFDKRTDIEHRSKFILQ